MSNRFGLMDESISILKQVSALASDKLYLVKFNLGLVYFESNQYDQAILNFQQAIALNPGFATPHFYLGNTLLQQRMYDQANIHFKSAIKIYSQKLKKRYVPNEIDGLRKTMLERHILSYANIGLSGDLTNDEEIAIVYTLKAIRTYQALTGSNRASNDWPNIETHNLNNRLNKMLKKYKFNSIRQAAISYKKELMELARKKIV